jgi:hypothetical protein
MKPYIKELMCQLAFTEDTMLFAPPRKVVAKGTKKIIRYTPKESSTGQISSVLIINFPITNRHKLSHHFQIGKVHVLTIHCAIRFQRLLYIRIYHTLHICQRSRDLTLKIL